MILFPHLSSEDDVMQNQQENLKLNLSNQAWTKKGTCLQAKYDEFLITLMKIHLGLLNEDIVDRFKVSRALISVHVWSKFGI